MTTLKTVTKTVENLDEYSLVDVFRACYPEKSADEIDCLIVNINELCINHEVDFDVANFIYTSINNPINGNIRIRHYLFSIENFFGDNEDIKNIIMQIENNTNLVKL